MAPSDLKAEARRRIAEALQTHAARTPSERAAFDIAIAQTLLLLQIVERLSDTTIDTRYTLNVEQVIDS